MPQKSKAKRALQSNTAMTETNAKKRSAKGKSKAPKKKARVQNLNQQTDQEQKANEDKYESSDAGSNADSQEDAELTKETSDSELAKLLADAKAMQKTKAEAEAEIAQLTSDSELLAEATFWADATEPDAEPILHEKLRLAFIQSQVTSWKTENIVKLAQDEKTQEKHLKEVGKLDFDPCTDSTDPASCYRTIHAALETMKKYGVEYLVVAASTNYAIGENGERHTQFAKMDVKSAMLLRLDRRKSRKLYEGDLALCVRIIRAYFASDKACKKTKAAIQECRGQDAKIINYFVEIARFYLNPDMNMIRTLTNLAVKEINLLHTKRHWNVKLSLDELKTIFNAFDACPRSTWVGVIMCEVNDDIVKLPNRISANHVPHHVAHLMIEMRRQLMEVHNNFNIGKRGYGVLEGDDTHTPVKYVPPC